MAIGGRGAEFSAKREQDGGYWARVGIIGESACWRLCRGRHNRHTFATRLSAGGVADHFVTLMLRQGDAEVFKRYSQAKLAMMREALAKLDRNANQHQTFGTAAAN
jgi:hypothetical protein